MLELMTGNMFVLDVEAVVNPVNCQGVAGKGLALYFRKQFPDNFAAYQTACSDGDLRIGTVFTHTSDSQYIKHIINFPTKDAWKLPSKMCYIRCGLDALVREIKYLGIRSIAIPALGCGNGGLEFHDVLSQIEKAFQSEITLAGVRVYVFLPQNIYQPSLMR